MRNYILKMRKKLIFIYLYIHLLPLNTAQLKTLFLWLSNSFLYCYPFGGWGDCILWCSELTSCFPIRISLAYSGKYMRCWDQTGVAQCKRNFLPTILLLRPMFLSYEAFTLLSHFLTTFPHLIHFKIFKTFFWCVELGINKICDFLISLFSTLKVTPVNFSILL